MTSSVHLAVHKFARNVLLSGKLRLCGELLEIFRRHESCRGIISLIKYAKFAIRVNTAMVQSIKEELRVY